MSASLPMQLLQNAAYRRHGERPQRMAEAQEAAGTRRPHHGCSGSPLSSGLSPNRRSDSFDISIAGYELEFAGRVDRGRFVGDVEDLIGPKLYEQRAGGRKP